MKNIATLKYAPAFALLVALLAIYQYSGAWTSPNQAPPDGNVPAPVNVGTQTQDKNGTLGVTNLGVLGGEVLLNSGAPTMRFVDTNDRNWWTHINQNRFHLIADRNDDGNWNNEWPWPMEMEAGATAAQDYVRFANQVRAPFYCDENGNNCRTAISTGGGVDYNSCRDVRNYGSGPNYVSVATCNANEVMVSGGGRCGYRGSGLGNDGDTGMLHASYPSGVRQWVIDCYRNDDAGDVVSEAIGVCCALR